MVHIANFSLGWSEYPTQDWALNVYFSGCEHYCKDCQNPSLQDSNSGIKYPLNSLYEIISEKCKSNRTNKIVLLGGDPLFNSNILAVNELLSFKDFNICIYTGYDLEYAKKKIPNLNRVKYIKTGKFLSSQVRQSKKTDTHLILSSPNQVMFKLENGKFKRISENGIVMLEM